MADVQPTAGLALPPANPPAGTISRPAPSPGPRPLPPATANREGEAVTESLAFPTGDRSTSVLLLEKTFPAQARLGKAYRYDLKVTNLTDHPLTNVVVRERVPESFQLAQPAAPTTNPAEPPATAPTDPAAAPHAGTEAQEGRDVQQFAIGDLGPKQSKSVPVSGVASRLGRLATLTSVSYTPLLAAGTEVINPILKLSMTGPAQSDLCQELAYKYTISNVGTGTETNVRIEENLPNGLTTADGKKAIAIDVGSLPEGQSRDYTVKLKAAAVGLYTGRAVAHGTGTEAQSQEVATAVQAPKLAVAVTGPETEYVNKTAAYDLVVTNTGDAPARDTIVAVSADNAAEPVFFAGVRADAPAGGANGAAPAPQGGPQPSLQQSLGTIDPGQSKKARVAFRPIQGGPLHVGVTARATCADAVSSKATTNVQTIASLALEVRSRDNLVRVGENALYTIRVRNQGSGADAKVRVTATLPPQLSLVKTTGPTDPKADAQKLSFAPMATLAPGATAEWTVEAKALQPGDVRFRVELTSESLTEPALEAEPTKLY